MGVKSYVAGLKADAENTLLDLGIGGLEAVSKLAAARDKTDVNRESRRIQESAQQFINDLQYDRDYQGYEGKANEWYNDALASIQENENLSGRARKELLENQLPVLRESVLGKVPVLQQNAHLAEIKIELDQFGDVLSSDLTKPLSDTLVEYRNHIEDLDLFNEVTVNKMVKEYEYATAPIKAIQTLQVDYMENNIKDKYSFSESIDQVAINANLDAAQKAAMKSKALEFQASYDKQLDSQFNEQKEILLGQVAEARDQSALFDTDSIDNFIQQVPPRHKLELFKVKNTALANNDEVIVDGIKNVTDNYSLLNDEAWNLIDTIHDPYKRDEVSVSALVSSGSALIAQGASFVDARKAIDAFERTSISNRNKAKAELTKQYLDEESDVTKVANSLMDSVASTKVSPLIPGNIAVDSTINTSDLVVYTEGDNKVLIPATIEGESVSEEEAVEHYIETGEHLGKFESVEDLIDFTADLPQEVEEEPKPEEEDEDTPEPIKVEEGEDIQEPWEQAPWMKDYQSAVLGRRQEVEQEAQKAQDALEKQLKHVQSSIGAKEEKEEEDSQRLTLVEGMDQIDLVTTALQIIKDGDGKYLTPTELALIEDKDLRQELTTLASIRDSLLIDSPLALDFIDQLRRDKNVSDIKLRAVVSDFVDRGFIKAETGDGLTEKYSFAENENAALLNSTINSIAGAVYPPKKGKVFEVEKGYLTTRLREAADDAIAMNPDLMGKDFATLQKQLETFALNSLSKTALETLEDIAGFMATEDISKRIKKLEKSSVQTFLQDVAGGYYDLLINWDFVQQDKMRASRDDKKDVLLDKVTTEITPYKNYKDLESNGTHFEKMRVMANSAFILAGGTLEKALTGSFNVLPSDMKLFGNQWGFKDPLAEDVYFIPIDTDMKGRKTLGWGMARGNSDGVKELIKLDDYVDPQLVYNLEKLEAQMQDPFFLESKRIVDAGWQTEPLSHGGVSATALLRQGKTEEGLALMKQAYGPNQPQRLSLTTRIDQYERAKVEVDKVESEYEKLSKELEELMSDIMTYRFNLLGFTAPELPSRL